LAWAAEGRFNEAQDIEKKTANQSIGKLFTIFIGLQEGCLRPAKISGRPFKTEDIEPAEQGVADLAEDERGRADVDSPRRTPRSR
jgi:hypothetical protein